MSNTFENLKGTYDYLPDKQIIREEIRSVLQPIFVKYGFAPVETPILCKHELLASKYSEGADILNEMYKLKDQGQRDLGLRYDLTVTFSKLISSNRSITLPFKRYEIGKVFRNGPVKLGRNREFTQCDVDVVGIKSVLAEAEYMMMTTEVFSKLGVDVVIEFNNRKLLSGIIRCVLGDISDALVASLIILIDKFAKLTEGELLSQFATLGVNSNKASELRDFLNSDYKTIKEKLAPYNNELVAEGLKEIDELYSYVTGTEAFNHMQFAPYLARGINVYTGTVWEGFVKGRKVGDVDFTSSLCAGGRYDEIITLFVNDGNEYPAVGMTFGLDVIYELLTLMSPDRKPATVDAYIIPMNTEVVSFKFATKLREVGVKTDMEKTSKKLKKSMEYANKMKIPFVVIIGEDEVKNGKVNVKNMATGESKEFSINDAVAISEHIRG